MRNFLSQKLWSLGTPLGSLGPGSQKGLPEIFSNVVFLHHWDPNEALEKVSYPLLSKKLVALRKRCGIDPVQHILFAQHMRGASKNVNFKASTQFFCTDE